nr:MAG TPA: hypothetical protein [Caudoviricetes sp.]
MIQLHLLRQVDCLWKEDIIQNILKIANLIVIIEQNSINVV